MPVLILGSEGAQGKRYQSILRFLEVEYVRKDLGLQELSKLQMKKAVDKVIIATPTETHAESLFWCLEHGIGRSFLIEKPVSKDLGELSSMLYATKHEISMVFQYRQLVGKQVHGPTEYDYFRHGSDGLIWDCLQIIGLARGKVTLKETSPLWKCRINGLPLKIQDMDRAYVLEVADWLEGKGFRNPEKILKIHDKVSIFDL